MLEKFIKKDKNEELEQILEEKNIEEQAKNLLQGILYKIEVSYKDYKKAKKTEITEEQYVEEILQQIKRNCNQIKIVKLSDKIEQPEIQKELEKNKFYIKNNEIISYPIEEKILYAIQKNANIPKIVNNKYGILVEPLSKLINTGRNIDKIEVLRDFNGWSWTTIKSEIENLKINLVYQTLRILLGEEFLNNWTQDRDGIIDYISLMKEELSQNYEQTQIIELLYKISMITEIEQNSEFKEQVNKLLEELNNKIEDYENTQENILKITKYKKEATQKIREIEKILSQEANVKEEYQKRNTDVPIHQKIFSIKVLKQQLNEQKQNLLDKIEKYNYYLNPTNYLNEKNKLVQEKQLLEVINYNEEQKQQIMIEFEKIFLKYFENIIKKQEEPEKITKLIYQFRYFMLLPFNNDKNIKAVEELQEDIIRVEKKLLKVAIEKKVINPIPFEVMQHILETRIIVLEELYFKIIIEQDKKYVQIFDENISEEKFEISSAEKVKPNKKIRIFIL